MPDGMLKRLGRLIGANLRSLMGDPPCRFRGSFPRHLPQDVRQVVERVDELLNIRILDGCYRVGSRHRDGIAAAGIVDSIDVVRTGERVSVGCAPVYIEPLASEQKNADVDSGVIQGLNSCPEPIEIGLREFAQVKSRLAVRRSSGSCSLPWVQIYGEVGRRAGRRR